MPKSVFLLDSDKRRMKLQHRRMREALGGDALKLEGPFRDRHGALSSLAEKIMAGRERFHGGSLRSAALCALGPQNLDRPSDSWLQTPFVVGGNHWDLDLYSAGAIASCNAIAMEGRQVRMVDGDALAVLMVAVLRRLGIPALFAYQHMDLEHPSISGMVETERRNGNTLVFGPIPSILTMDGGCDVYAFCPGKAPDFPGGGLIKAVEVLGDEAVSALMVIRTAHGRMKTLMHDVATRGQHFEGEGAKRAMGTGHLLHEGISGWSVRDAEQSLHDAEDLLSRKESGLMSSRSIIESTHVGEMLCPLEHFSLASRVMLRGEGLELVSYLVDAATRRELDLLKQIVERIPQNPAIANLASYTMLEDLLIRHVHPERACPEIDANEVN